MSRQQQSTRKDVKGVNADADAVLVTIDESVSRDEIITVRLHSGDRYTFEDEQGCELVMVEVGTQGDPHAISVYTYGPKGNMLGYIALFR